MRQVECHPDVFHVSDEHPPELGQTAVVQLQTPATGIILLHVCQLQHPESQLLPDEQILLIQTDKGRILRKKNVRQLALGMGVADSLCTVAQAERRFGSDDIQKVPHHRPGLHHIAPRTRDGQGYSRQPRTVGPVGSVDQVLHTGVDNDGCGM